MNNLISVEKTLKHWLKKRVTITTATVVGFLIMGAATFAAAPNGATTVTNEVTTTQGNTANNVTVTDTGSIKIKTTQTDDIHGIKIKDGGKPLTALNKGNIEVINSSGRAIGIGLEAKGSHTKNSGKIIVNGKTDSIGITGLGEPANALKIYNGFFDESSNGNKTEIFNPTAEINATSESGNASVIKVTAGGAEINNNGIMRAISKGADKEAIGIDLQGNGSIINEGEIFATVAEGTATGVKVKDANSLVENLGRVQALGKTAKGIEVADGAKIYNKEDFTEIFALGTEGSTGVSLTENSSLENDGLIYAEVKSGEQTGKADTVSKAYGVSYTATNRDTGKGGPVIQNEVGAEIIALSDKGEASAIHVENKGKSDVEVVNRGLLVAGRAGATKTHVVDLIGKANFTNEDTGIIVVAEDTKGGIGIYSENDGNITNAGEIRLDKGVTNGAGILVGSSAGNVNVKNTGLIALPITTKDGIESKNVAINIKGSGTAENSGTIQITDKTVTELEKLGFDINSLFNGSKKVQNIGQVVDKDGKAIKNENSVYLDDEKLTTESVNKEGKEKNSVTLGKLSEDTDGKRTTITGGKEPITLGALNFVGKVWVGERPITQAPSPTVDADTASKVIAINSDNMNFDKDGYLTVYGGNTLELNGTTIQKTGENKDTINLQENSTLTLNNVNINKANILGTGSVKTNGHTMVNADIFSKDLTILGGDTGINGKISTDKVDVGTGSKLTLDSDSSFGKETTITSTGITVFNIGSNGQNALSNSTKKVTVTGNVDFNTSELTQNKTVDLDNGEIKHDLQGATYKDAAGGIYNTQLNKTDNTLNFTYNNTLFDSPELNSVNNAMQTINNKVTQNVQEREKLVDNIYSGGIYSETVRASYEGLQLNENVILSLDRVAKAGEMKTHGKALYSKNGYERFGAKNTFDTDIETIGLLAGFEYGLSDSMAIGTVLSGAKQSVDVERGNADGDLFYIGLYTTQKLGNYDLTAGTGYQFGKYRVDNNLISNTGDKYDSNAIGTYVQARYNADFGGGLVLQPKVKLGHTYLNQTEAKDDNFGLKDTDISVFNAETGFDVVKTVQLPQSKLDIKFGASYIKTLGDTDKEFTGEFYGTNVSNEFDVLGAELTENTLRFSLGAEIENEKGFFYNGGFSYEFGSNNTKTYGANLGVGYKF